MIYHAKVNSDGTVAGVGRTVATSATSAAMVATLSGIGQTPITSADFATLQSSGTANMAYTSGSFSSGGIYNGGTLTPYTPAFDLSAAQAKASTKVDTAAEAVRLTFVTAGSGQALEYQATQDEAEAANAAADPLDATL